VVTLQRGQIWWADLDELQGSQPGYRRPVLIVQEDHFNQSRLATVIVLSLTSNLKFQELPGNVYLSKRDSGGSLVDSVQATRGSSMVEQAKRE
jgi:mRNA interferase MazF